MTLDDIEKIESAVRARGGNWQTYFRREGGGWQCILFPAERLNEDEYANLSRRLSANSSVMSPREKAVARARAAADRHG